MIDLSPDHLEIVARILAERVPACEVRAFGSRATWTAKDHSDLDLAIACEGPLPPAALARLQEAFEESRLPMRVDVVDWHALAEDFREAIEGDCVVLQEAASRADEWPTVTLDEALKINPTRPLTRGAATPFVAMADLVENQRLLPALADREFQGGGSRFRNGDTLLARITPSLENGKTAYVSVLPNGVIGHGSTEFIVLAAREGVTDQKFVYYLALSPEFRSHAIAQMTGSSGRQRVPAGAIRGYKFRLPPLDEQRRIARILGALDDKIELNRRMNATLEEMARALFRSWFVDFDPVHAKAEGRPTGLPAHLDALFPATFEPSELGDIPAGWSVKPLGEVIAVYGGNTPSTKEPTYWGGTYPFATPKDLSTLNGSILSSTARRLTKKGLARIHSGLLPVGTVLLSSRAPIGYLAVTEIAVATNQGVIAMVCDGTVGSSYMLHWTRENMDSIKAVSIGTTFAEVSKSTFREIPLVLPCEAVHAAWQDFIAPMYEILVLCTHESRALAEQRDALLPRLLSGELRLPADV